MYNNQLETLIKAADCGSYSSYETDRRVGAKGGSTAF